MTKSLFYVFRETLIKDKNKSSLKIINIITVYIITVYIITLYIIAVYIIAVYIIT